MGNFFTVNMEENFKRNQEFVTKMNAIKIEQQLQMSNQMRERQVAWEIAKSRELLIWYSAFFLTSATCVMTSYRYKRKPVVLTPLLPLAFFKHTKLIWLMEIIEAEHILQFESDTLALPLGVPTASSIDYRRLENDEQKKLHPVLP
ncbi:hypothetical protein NQ317_009918 [Molorchus minor]|uniref:Plasminogen receptor (KT) n=1 Tax=Molorchus minor TaxID=1323400 RepID=A0ABQ9K9I1_9CUCU|nr:hypothetical protein NQ317_009918 [Molorchus minor]